MKRENKFKYPNGQTAVSVEEEDGEFTVNFFIDVPNSKQKWGTV